MNILWYIHFLIPISIVLTPILPINILRYIFWWPIVLYIIWIIFGTCPITKATKVSKENPDSKNFILPILRKLISNKLTKNQSDHIVNIIILLSIIISGYRLLYTCESKKKKDK